MKKKEKKYTGAYREINAFLGQETEFVGKLVFSEAVRMDGKFSGEIFSSGSLIIGESAVVSAEIKVDTIIIEGIVNGNVEAKSSIELSAPGKLYGNIKTPVLIINEGVMFQGNCQMEEIKKEEGKIAAVEEIKVEDLKKEEREKWKEVKA